jgi:uncharacterized protein YdeI (YjbR/CyaY-like superfamily)
VAGEPEELIVAGPAEWREWLETNHATSPGVRLVLARKGADGPTALTHGSALQEALCFGWIDGQAGRRDDGTFTVRFTPRRPRSIWSQRNVAFAERLIAEGRMTPAGLAEVDRARADGRWAAAYAGPAAMTMPDDLAAALAASPAAKAMFERLSSQNRYAILFRTHQAKRPETRARRIAQFVAMLERGETIYPQRG